MRLLDKVLSEVKEKGFLNTRIKGSHPGYTVSVGGVLLSFPVSEIQSLDLSDFGFTTNKVHQLIRGYYPKDSVEEWLARINLQRSRGSVDADETFFPGGSHGHARGPCLTAMGFRETLVEPPTLTVYSRSSEFPHKWFADLWSFAGVATLLETENLQINWFISLIWMDARTANYLRVMKDPLPGPFTSNERFNAKVDQQWDDYILPEDRVVSYSTLKNLRRLHRKNKPLKPILPEIFRGLL